ncbi:rod shape-determining protein MreC [Campylobacter troglodytis]|uniref:rod shape-determining protein MreC n=1 Tax=Campylobacter troglodytis TaxID=654363 RepID=UPI00115724B2|nr:rod shape-determining protein MreC [Campylobacter troglodytis]TQR61246.1 rod shape-determining protein MreC [Campylobacter troglodytis]
MKNKIYLALILGFLLFVSFYFGLSIKNSVLLLNDSLINAYYNSKNYLKELISEHFNQAEQIRILREQNRILEEGNALASTFASQLNLLLEDKNSSQYFPQLSLIKALSYVQISDYNRIWINAPTFSDTKNKGLIYQGYTAGIAITREGRAMALLQSDENCVFSVVIGKDKIPGVLQGRGDRVGIKFIPKFNTVNIGDEVLTSGLDGVFFSGVPVGKITRVINEAMYNSAEIEPFAKIELPSYMYVIDKF